MTINLTPLHPTLGAELHGVDLTAVTPEAFAEIEAAFNLYGILVFPEQPLTDEQQLAFSRLFGPLQVNPNYAGTRLRLRPDLADISNLDPEERVLARDGLVVEHSIFRSRSQIGFADFNDAIFKELPPVRQALVRHHRYSGRTSLYLASHASRIISWPVEEGREVIEELIAFATQPQFVHRHRWTVGDLVIWDNRCTMHRGRPYDMTQRRVLHRTTVADCANTLEQERLPAIAAA